LDQLTQAEISHQIYLNKLSAYYTNQFDDIELEIIRLMRLAFSEVDDIETLQNTNELNQKIDELLTPVLEQYIEEQEQAIEELAEQEVSFQDNLFNIINAGVAGAYAGAITASLKRYRIDLIPIDSNGAAVNIKKRVSSFPKDVVEHIKGIIKGGYSQGANIDDIRKSLTGTAKNKYRDGFVNTIKRDQKSVIDTARKHMETTAKLQYFQFAKTDGYMLTAVLDGHTSDICLGWNGTIVLWSQKFKPAPPFHYRCRTTVVPYIKGVTQKTQGGFTWLKKQSADFQDDLIGPVRGDLLRNSGLSADEFRKASRNNLNEPITLDEMAAKNKEIADRLNDSKDGV
jgi:SPP1 gp7 family putative phage head morphogenesis protein